MLGWTRTRGREPTQEPDDDMTSAILRVLELYCGIGGAAAAVDGDALVVQAYDVSELALTAYRSAYDHAAGCVSLESIAVERLADARADLWWLSPPCQPFTRRGLGRDVEDPRSRSLLFLIPKIVQLGPRFVALENVPGFAGSETHRRFRTALSERGYRFDEQIICPSELGVPMRRRRFYLLAAAAEEPLHPRSRSDVGRALRNVVDERFDEHPELVVGDGLLRDYRGALDIVARDDPDAICACFTSAYGRSPVRSGSYLRLASGGVRRFHPREILKLLGFPPEFDLPESLACRQAWRLVGNSLSVDVVRRWLSAVL